MERQLLLAVSSTRSEAIAFTMVTLLVHCHISFRTLFCPLRVRQNFYTIRSDRGRLPIPTSTRFPLLSRRRRLHLQAFQTSLHIIANPALIPHGFLVITSLLATLLLFAVGPYILVS